MKRYSLMILGVVLMMACNKDKKIIWLLNSKNFNDRMEGIFEPGESRDKKYVPLILKNADGTRASTALHFKGFTVYTEKMYALEKILHIKPPHAYSGILVEPDSVNIKFYNQVWSEMQNHH